MRLLRVAEVGELLGVDPQRVYEMIRSKLLPPGVAVRLGRQVRINQAALDEWIRTGGQALPGGWRRESDT
jgi:excisionase family DNA binding protein